CWVAAAPGGGALCGSVGPPRARGAGNGPCAGGVLADLSTLSRRTLCTHAGGPCHRLAHLGRDGRIPGRVTPALGDPGNRYGRGGATPGRGPGAPGLGAPRGSRCNHTHAHGYCPREGAPPWPASDTGVGHIVCPCLP